VEARERDVARRGAQLEGDADAADAQAAELERRIEGVTEELGSAADAISQLDVQGDLFAGRLQDLATGVERALDEVERALTEVAQSRVRLDGARAAEMDAGERAASLRARKAALERLERDREGIEPVIRAALELREHGVLGSLADAIAADPDTARVVETYLGPLARALVVRDSGSLAKVRAWFTREWTGGGGLILLALDRAPASAAAGTLLARVTLQGEGAPWARALLEGVDLVDDDVLDAAPGRERVARSGAVTDRRGVMRLGDPTGSSGLLERKELLRSVARAAKVRTARSRAPRQRSRPRDGRCTRRRTRTARRWPRWRRSRTTAVAWTDTATSWRVSSRARRPRGRACSSARARLARIGRRCAHRR
jgi:chromosome segregation ATPase